MIYRSCESVNRSDVLLMLKGRGLKPSALKVSKGRKCRLREIHLNHKGLEDNSKHISYFPCEIHLRNDYCYDFSGSQREYVDSLKDVLFCVKGIVKMNVG